MIMAVMAIGPNLKAVAQDGPTSIIVIKPASQSAQAPALPGELQQESESALAGMRIHNWISLTGYGFYPPVPWNWCQGRTDVSYWWSPTLGTNAVLIDDSLLPYEDWAAQARATRLSADDSVPPPPGGGGGSDTNPPSGQPLDHGPNEFWLELWQVDMTNQLAYLALHGTVPGEKYQLQMKTDLNDAGDWILGEIRFGAAGTNRTDLNPVPLSGIGMMYFRAHHADVVVSIDKLKDAIEPHSATGDSGQAGLFYVTASGLTNSLTMHYHIGGVASNGLDYTNLSGVVTIPVELGFAYIYVNPIEHNDLDFDETAIVAPLQTNTYLINPTHSSTNVVIHDNFVTNIFLAVTTSIFGMTGLDYHPPSQSLTIGLGELSSAAHTFLRVATNGALSDWSGMGVSVDELKLAIPKETVAGFTNGDIYFNNQTNGGIGWISSNGATWLTNWALLNGETNLIQGGFYVDRTGIFSNQLIAVTGIQAADGANVWLVDSLGNSRKLVSISNVHCEGVITLSNDVTRYGPLAEKIITGADEPASGPPLIYAIDPTNGVTSFDFGITAEHFDVIPANQDLYVISEFENNDGGLVLKLSHSLLTNYVGDLLITQGGRYVGEPALYIVHWDGSRFVIRGIPLNFYSQGVHLTDEIESVTFAPINIPPTP